MIEIVLHIHNRPGLAGLILVYGCSCSVNSYSGLFVQGKKSAVKPVIEMGTQQNTDIDYDWLPKETTTEFGKKLHSSSYSISFRFAKTSCQLTAGYFWTKF